MPAVRGRMLLLEWEVQFQTPSEGGVNGTPPVIGKSRGHLRGRFKCQFITGLGYEIIAQLGDMGRD